MHRATVAVCGLSSLGVAIDTYDLTSRLCASMKATWPAARRLTGQSPIHDRLAPAERVGLIRAKAWKRVQLQRVDDADGAAWSGR